MQTTKLIMLVMSFIMTLFLANCQKTIDPETKQEITIKGVMLDGFSDLDEDGYASYLRFNFDVDVSSGSKNVFIKLGVRFTDPADTSTYFEYFESSPITIEGATSEDAKYVSVGLPNTELPQAGYDFLFIVFDAEEADTRLAEISAKDNSLIRNIPIENSATDIAVTIFDAWFGDEVDNDGDGYVSQATLWVDVDEYGYNGTEVFLALYDKLSSASDYELIGLSDPFVINGTASEDLRGLTLSGYATGSYDFRVETYFNGNYYVEDMVDAGNTSALASVNMEPTAQDQQNPLTITFNNTAFTDISITISGLGTKLAPIGGSAVFTFTSNPGTFVYHAETSGKTSGGAQVGLKMLWDYTKNVSGQTSVIYNLQISADYFFIYMQNSGTGTLSPIYVNYGKTDQTVDYVLIPNDNVKYRIGYYRAYSDTQVRAYFYQLTTYVFWDLSLPFTVNQNLNLTNSFKIVASGSLPGEFDQVERVTGPAAFFSLGEVDVSNTAER